MSQQRSLILLLLLTYLFAPTLIAWIYNPTGVWYKPYLVWILVIIMAYFAQKRKNS